MPVLLRECLNPLSELDQAASNAGVSPEALSAARSIFALEGLRPVRQAHWSEDYPQDSFIVHMARIIDREIRK
jgi:hypothetical protein